MRCVLVGGGPIGLIAAASLRADGHSVRLFDPRTDKPTMSLALAESTLRLLEGLGIDQLPGETLTSVHVSEQGVPGSMLLDAAELGYSRFGQIVPSEALEAQLIDQVSDVIEASAVDSIEPRSRTLPPRVTLATGEVIETDLVILADGGRSHLTEQLGFVPFTRAFARTALLGRIHLSQPVSGRAYERFVGTGPLALLPLGDTLHGFVWSLDPSHARACVDDPEALVTLFEQTVDPILGSVSMAKDPVALDLIERWIDQPYRPGVLLLGNGAQTIHPVAGQGLNLALRGLRHVLDALAHDDPDEAVVQAMGRWRTDRDRTRFASSVLETIFDRPNPLRRLATATSMSLLDQSRFVKRQIAEAGMGLLS